MENIKIGDICEYKFNPPKDNKSFSIVQVVKILTEEVAAVKFLEVLVDDSGNNFFKYLLNTNKEMNVSIKYLHKIENYKRKTI